MNQEEFIEKTNIWVVEQRYPENNSSLPKALFHNLPAAVEFIRKGNADAGDPYQYLLYGPYSLWG